MCHSSARPQQSHKRVVAIQVGVSLVLSFMVVWDFPTIARGVQSLRSSRLRAIYTEVAPTFTVFGQLFGKALQAQVATTALPLPCIGVTAALHLSCGM